MFIYIKMLMTTLVLIVIYQKKLGLMYGNLSTLRSP